MRVLHVYSGNLYGGVEAILVMLARCRDLCPAMEPYFALCFEGRLSEELLTAGVSCHLLGNVQVSRPWTVWKARRRLAELLRREGFDVVVCHSAWSQAIFGPTVQSAGLPLIFWQHDATNGRHWLERWAGTTVPDLVICNSRFTAGTLPNLYPNVPAEVLYCPVLAPEANQSHAERTVMRAEMNTPEGAVVIVQVSRMEAWKGHGLLLEALGKLRHVPGWMCWQVGGAQRQHEMQYLESLRSAASRLGIGERVLFLGQRSDVSRLLAAADIHCQPNTGPEPFGMTFVEALQAGLPVVTTAIGGALEIVNDSCGILVRPHDPGALAESLRQLVQDAPLRRRLGTAGVNRARELCDPSTQMRKLFESMTSVVRKTVCA